MPETVTITPLAGSNTDGDPLPAGEPFTVTPLQVAPGNTLQSFGAGGDLDTADFTVFLPLRMRVDTDDEWIWQPTTERLTEHFAVEVRGRTCVGRAQEWSDGGRGGVAVLCTSATGRSS